jgi:hypothetical protein
MTSPAKPDTGAHPRAPIPPPSNCGGIAAAKHQRCAGVSSGGHTPWVHVARPRQPASSDRVRLQTPETSDGRSRGHQCLAPNCPKMACRWPSTERRQRRDTGRLTACAHIADPCSDRLSASEPRARAVTTVLANPLAFTLFRCYGLAKKSPMSRWRGGAGLCRDREWRSGPGATSR